ncbi:hypothetical protein ACFL0W_05760, partial [Nanoarchaeota archaeon]
LSSVKPLQPETPAVSQALRETSTQVDLRVGRSDSLGELRAFTDDGTEYIVRGADPETGLAILERGDEIRKMPVDDVKFASRDPDVPDIIKFEDDLNRMVERTAVPEVFTASTKVDEAGDAARVMANPEPAFYGRGIAHETPGGSEFSRISGCATGVCEVIDDVVSQSPMSSAVPEVTQTHVDDTVTALKSDNLVEAEARFNQIAESGGGVVHRETAIDDLVSSDGRSFAQGTAKKSPSDELADRIYDLDRNLVADESLSFMRTKQYTSMTSDEMVLFNNRVAYLKTKQEDVRQLANAAGEFSEMPGVRGMSSMLGDDIYRMRGPLHAGKPVEMSAEMAFVDLKRINSALVSHAKADAVKLKGFDALLDSGSSNGAFQKMFMRTKISEGSSGTQTLAKLYDGEDMIIELVRVPAGDVASFGDDVARSSKAIEDASNGIADAVSGSTMRLRITPKRPIESIRRIGAVEDILNSKVNDLYRDLVMSEKLTRKADAARVISPSRLDLDNEIVAFANRYKAGDTTALDEMVDFIDSFSLSESGKFYSPLEKQTKIDALYKRINSLDFGPSENFAMAQALEEEIRILRRTATGHPKFSGSKGKALVPVLEDGIKAGKFDGQYYIAADVHSMGVGNKKATRELAEKFIKGKMGIDELKYTVGDLRDQKLAEYVKGWGQWSEAGKVTNNIYTTGGDEVIGVLAGGKDEALKAVNSIMSKTHNEIETGVGLARISPGMTPAQLDNLAEDAGMVTKLLKGTGHEERYVYVWGEALDNDAAITVLKSLEDTMRKAESSVEISKAQAFFLPREMWTNAFKNLPDNVLRDSLNRITDLAVQRGIIDDIARNRFIDDILTGPTGVVRYIDDVVPSLSEREAYISVLRTRFADNPGALESLEQGARTWSDSELISRARNVLEPGVLDDIARRYPSELSPSDSRNVFNQMAGGEIDDVTIDRLRDNPNFLGEGQEGIVLEIPDELRGQYRVISERDVVIKIKTSFEEQEGFISFSEQAELLNKLADKGVAPRAYGYADDFYIVDKVEGKAFSSLSDAQKQRLRPKVEQLTQALIDEGVLIQDFGGANIFVTTTGEVKIIDVGETMRGASKAELEKFYQSETSAIIEGVYVIG